MPHQSEEKLEILEGELKSLDFESVDSHGKMTTWRLSKFSGLVVLKGTNIA